jgi:hypothetical protein
VGNLAFSLFDGEWGLSCCQGQWGVPGLCTLWEKKPPGASRIAKPGDWGSLKCVVAGSWHWVESWGYPWGSKVDRLKSSGAHRHQRPRGVSFQVPCQLPQAKGNKVSRRHELWGLFTGSGLPRAIATAADIGEPSLWVAGALGPDFPHGLQGVQFCGAVPGELSQLVFAFCYPWSSGSYGSWLHRSTSFPGVSGWR